MFKFIFIIFCFNLSIKKIISYKIENCEVNSNCKGQYCSNYGNCNFQQVNTSNIIIFCQCNKGYSSYDIDKNLTKYSEDAVYCCYKKKSILTSFLLELFLGFGIGHFYLGNTVYFFVKLFIELFFCLGMICVMYYSCIREHPFQTNIVEVNNNENIGKNNLNENKNNKENEGNEENEEKINENIIDNKNNESKDESFELEENKENERMFQNFISCPKSKFFIYLSIIIYFLFNFIDAVLIAFGVFHDKNGEELYLFN